MFVLYNVLLTILSPIWVTWMFVRASRRAEKPNWKERQGNYDLLPLKDGERIWIHAVSVGEVMASLPILRQVRALLPEHEIVLSVTTSSGHHTAREHAVDLFDHLVYFPIDVPRFQLAAMVRVRPKVVAVMETELWLNFLWAAKSLDATTMLINGRISDRNFRRSKHIRFFYRDLLSRLDRSLMQTAADAERIAFLGAKAPEVLGNSKFDQAVDGLDADPDQWRKDLGLRPDVQVVVIGSTRGEDEEQLVLYALKRVGLNRVSVVHAPRHIERVPDLAQRVLETFGSVALRSKNEQGDYTILDTYGELAKVYSVADIVVIGGGFGDYGGQNLLQPMAHGKPVLHGPHMQNFRDVAKAAGEIGATRVCDSADHLAQAIEDLLRDPALRKRMGDAGKKFVEENAGASRRYALAIAEAAKAVPTQK